MILKRPSFRRGGNSGIGSLTPRTKLQFGSSSFKFLEPGLQQDLRLSEELRNKNLRTSNLRTPSGGLSKGTRGARLLTQLRNLAIPGASTAASLAAIPVATAGGLAYLNRPRTLAEKEYMQSMGALDETMSGDDLKTYFDERERLSKEGDEISFSDALFMDPETGTYPKIFGRTEDRETRKNIEEAEKAETAGSGDLGMRGDPAQFTGEDELTNFEAILRDQNRGPEVEVEESSITLDPKEEIKKEADFIKDLLKNENLSRGENALILAKAIREPGSISDKIDKATDLVLPVVRKRAERDKAITLKAYENYKRKELEEAKAGKPTNEMRNIKRIAEARKRKTNDKRPISIIMDEVVLEQQGGKEGTKIVTAAAKEIIDITSSIDKQRGLLAKETNEKKKAKIEEKIKTLQKELGRYATFDGFDEIYRGYRKAYLADGGRVERAEGTPMEGETTEVVETVADTPGAPTPERQVLKLSYAELRNKLPKEISDDIVELLANSTEALQDFAYITTQDDVGNFNVKYGVNLVIPQTA
mgnify:CR=1 FL=1|jgi:hypothetical protein